MYDLKYLIRDYSTIVCLCFSPFSRMFFPPNLDSMMLQMFHVYDQPKQWYFECYFSLFCFGVRRSYFTTNKMIYVVHKLQPNKENDICYGYGSRCANQNGNRCIHLVCRVSCIVFDFAGSPSYCLIKREGRGGI